MYKIKYCYNTGDSFHTEFNLESTLELEWSNLEVAQQNLQRIKEHYTWYKLLNKGYYRGIDHDKNCKEATKIALTKDWICKKQIKGVWKVEYDFSIILKTDDGKDWQFCAPWCGYFESLNWIEVELKYNPNRIEF